MTNKEALKWCIHFMEQGWRLEHRLGHFGLVACGMAKGREKSGTKLSATQFSLI